MRSLSRSSVPRGRRQAIVEGITKAVLDAEGGKHERDPLQVRVVGA